MSKDNILPPGWARVNLADVSVIRSGVGFPKSLQGKASGEVPFVKVSDISAAVLETDGVLTGATNYISSEQAQDLRAKIFTPGTTLFAKIGEAIRLNRRVITRVAAVADNNVMGLIPEEEATHPKYLYYFMRTINLHDYAQATAVPSVRKSDIEQVDMPLPPINEQRRIVATIEEQFSRLDAGVSALERVRANLRRYRTAVLKAAVEGRLTGAWREENPDVEPAPKLLERTLKERRERWEKDQLAAYEKKGKKPPKNWRSKYKEPAEPNMEDLPRLPEGWSWITLDIVLSGITAGKSFKCEERPPEPGEVGIVKVSAVTWGEFNELESKTNTDPNRHNPDLLIHEGDFLFSRANTIALVGACVIVRRVSSTLMLSDKILRFRIVGIPQGWLLLALRTRHGRNEIERLTTGNQDSMRNISQENIRRIQIPLPPLQEQVEIIAEVERRLSILQEVEAEIEANLKRASRLRQAILKRAFEGRLVPQDPSDEPASELLERIRREREQASSKKPKRTQKRGTKVSPIEHAGTLF